jgi:tripartite-type tricarboxylate transporter receptor subunit TctC
MKPYALTAKQGCSAALATVAMLLTPSLVAHAQSQYPSRAIRIIVPYTPGGTVDILARTLGPSLYQALGQPVVIENRPGAGGNLGTEAVAKAAPDGYTLLMATNGPLTINPALNPIRYDPLRDFSPIIVSSTASSMLSVNSKLAAKTVGEFVDLAKSKPTELSVATSGIGTTSHLSLLQLARLADIKLTTVPHRGGAESIMAAVAGDVHAVFSDVVPAKPLIQEGRLRALATTGSRRSVITPEIPTFQEIGLKEFEISVWTGVFAPANTPTQVVEALNKLVDAALKDSALREKLIAVGIEPVGGSVPEAVMHLQREIPRWRAILEAAGLAPKKN